MQEEVEAEVREADADKPVTVEMLAEIAKNRMKGLNASDKEDLLNHIRVYARQTGVRGKELRRFMKQLRRMGN